MSRISSSLLAARIRSADITDETIYRERRRLIGAMLASPALTPANCGKAQPPSPPKAALSPAQSASGFTDVREPLL